MTLLDRYLEAVRRRLPRNQRDDIGAELRDVLLSQIEAEEASRRRPLTDDEVAEMLKRFGRPMSVAAHPAGIGAAHIGHFNMLFFMVLLVAASGAFISTLVAVRQVVKRRTSFA